MTLSEHLAKNGLFSSAIFCLVAGAGLHAAGQPVWAGYAWALGTAFVLAVLLGVIAGSLARGQFGLDIVAALSMAGSLLIWEPLAGIVIAVMFSGGQVLENFAQARARREMTALLSRVPRSAQLHLDGHITEVPLDDVKPGDRLLVRPGDVVPVDGTVSSDGAVLDESALTGESLPVRHAVGSPVMSGSTNAGGAFDMVAARLARDSTYAGIVRLVETAQQSRAPMARLADRYALAFLAFTVLLTGIAWVLSGDPVRALAVLVVATPCPLIIAVPVAIVAGLSRSANRGVLVKSGGALETLARARVLLFDKTGTLTGGAPAVVGVRPAPGVDAEDLLATAGSLAQASPHIVSRAIAEEARSRGLRLELPLGVEEEHGAGVEGRIAGRRVVLGSYDLVLSRARPSDWAARALAGADRDGGMTTFVARDGDVIGYLELADEVRPEAREALIRLRAGGVRRIVLVTGDRAEIAKAVAAQLPIDEVIAGATPAAKVQAVTAERPSGPTVMVGDGVNDAPALAAADVGIAMGARGAAASSEAADVVMLVDSLERLPDAFAIARRARAIALQSVILGMALSIAGMTAAALGYLTPVQGALLQEAIDVAAILNALRALGGGTAPRTRDDDSADASPAQGLEPGEVLLDRARGNP
jgi:heavy metal translocating P-type ATPase